MNIETINPLLVAAKLDAVRNFLLPEVQEDIEKTPRLVQAMWFLQYLSVPENYAGGLARFAHDLIGKYSDRVGPVGLQRDAKLSLAEIEDIVGQIGGEEFFAPISHGRAIDAIYSTMLGDDSREDDEIRKLRKSELSKLTAGDLHDRCIDAAKEHLAAFLFNVCTDPEVTFISPDMRGGIRNRRLPQLWYFPRLWECLFDFMDRHSAEVGGGFAETSITREIFDKLRQVQDLARRKQEDKRSAGTHGVMFLGNSRSGKSYAIRAYSRMAPWSVRIVACPPSGAESDLLREICRALGIRFFSTTPPLHEQRAAIDKVIRSARFLLIFDEAQMLYPQNGNRRTAPARLNYVRTQLMDIGIPTAFICTYQSWRQVENNYLKFSGFAQEQFDGRLCFAPIHLPSELTEAEMLEVARVHLPELDSDYLQFLVAPIRACKGDHLSYIENIALIARRYAAQRRLSVPQLEDIKQAISDVLGCFQPSAISAPLEPAAFAPDGDDERPETPIFERNQRIRSGSLLRLKKSDVGQKTRIEDPALVLAD